MGWGYFTLQCYYASPPYVCILCTRIHKKPHGSSLVGYVSKSKFPSFIAIANILWCAGFWWFEVSDPLAAGQPAKSRWNPACICWRPHLQLSATVAKLAQPLPVLSRSAFLVGEEGGWGGVRRGREEVGDAMVGFPEWAGGYCVVEIRSDHTQATPRDGGDPKQEKPWQTRIRGGSGSRKGGNSRVRKGHQACWEELLPGAAA